MHVLSRRVEENIALASRLPADVKFQELRQLVDNRLKVNQRGLDVLRQQLRAGQLADAEVTLGSIEEDFLMLQQRLGASFSYRTATP
jgi:hypothetical protein